MATPRKQNPTYGRKDHTGERYGMLTVVSLVPAKLNGEWCWNCRCDCGNERVVRAGGLAKIRSCGCTKFYRQLPPGVAEQNRVLSGYRYNARQRGHEWNLSVAEFAELISQDCHYCGCTPGHTDGKDDYNGLDRFDNNRGYDSSNVVPCCWTCNKAKGNLSYDEFRKWIFRVAEHQRSSGNP